MLVGADPDQLDGLAGKFDASADEVKGIHGAALMMIQRSPWAGLDAEHYEDLWRNGARARLDQAAQILQDAAKALRRNAEEQRKTSAADSDGFSSSAYAVPSPGDANASLKNPPPGTPAYDEMMHGSARAAGGSLWDMVRASPIGSVIDLTYLTGDLGSFGLDVFRYGPSDPRTMHQFSHTMLDGLDTGFGIFAFKNPYVCGANVVVTGVLGTEITDLYKPSHWLSGLMEFK